MKNLSLTRLALVALFVFSGLKIFATEPDFQVDGIYYKIVSLEERECSLYGPVYPDYNPDKIIIPSKVKFNGASFTVVSVFGDEDSRWKQHRYYKVKELILPNSVKTIEQSAFYNVRTLERVQMDGVEYIAHNAFEGCENLKTVSFAMNRLEYIGFAGFSDCRSLEKIIIPPSCKKIEKSAFLGCVNPRLTVVIQDSDEPLLCHSTFGSGKKIYIGRNIQGWNGYRDAERHTYQGDIYYFKEIEFGDRVTEMFTINPTRRYYNDLEYFPFKITIGVSIKEVPDFANDDMTIQSLYLVSAVPPHVKGTFSNRTYLHGTLYVPKGSLAAYKDAPVWKNFLNIQECETDRTIALQKAEEERRAKEEARIAEEKRKAQEERAKQEAERLAREHPVIPDGTKEITAFAYKGSDIKSITIPNSVTRIGAGAFDGCYYLKSVIIPNSVTSIGDRAFAYCRSLTYVEIPNSVTSIGSEAFYYCNLTSIEIPNSVTSIGNRAFFDCDGLKSVIIPNSVTSIGEYAFAGCSGLTSVTLNANAIVGKVYDPSYSIKNIFGNQVQKYVIGEEVTSIGKCAFYNCTGLTSINISNSVTSIGKDAFFGCTGLTSPVYNAHVFAYMPSSYGEYMGAYTIPRGIKHIAGRAFANCDKWKSIVIPNSVTYIGDGAFYRCFRLSSITIPNGVTDIGDETFYFCSFLTSIDIPNGVTSIGEDAFYHCSSLTSIEIPNSVTSIGKHAFKYCKKLKITLPKKWKDKVYLKDCKRVKYYK